MKRLLTLAVTLAVGGLSSAQASVLCTKRSGAVVIRDTCKRREMRLDPDALGLRGSKGDKGDVGNQGPPGVPGIAGSQGLPGPSFVVKDANGALVGFVTSMANFGGGTLNDIQVTVTRQVGHAVVALDADASGFLMCGDSSTYSRDLYYTTNDCGGTPLMLVNAAPTLVAVACPDPTTHLAYYPTGTGAPLNPAAARAITVNGLGSCMPDGGGGDYAPASTLDLTTLGLVPPFHVEAP
jgi:hypothetical protein